VRLLVERGARLDLRNSRGQTPLGALVARSARASEPSGEFELQSTIDVLRQLGAPE
jgi:hypothetical protein